MPTVDGDAFADTFVGFRTNRPGFCLYTVWQAAKANGATSSKAYPTAYSAYLASLGHGPAQMDKNPPRGAVIWLGPRAGSDPNAKAGDVFVSLGDGRCAATDYPSNGVIGICTIDQRIRQTGRPYLGWTLDLIGNVVATDEPADSGDVKPFPTPTPEPADEGDIEMRTIYNTERTDDENRRAAVGELTFQVQGPDASKRERRLWGDPIPVTEAEWNGVLATCNARRAMNGLHALKGVRGES